MYGKAGWIKLLENKDIDRQLDRWTNLPHFDCQVKCDAQKITRIRLNIELITPEQWRR